VKVIVGSREARSGPPEWLPAGEAEVRTQSRVTLSPNLVRVNAAARRAAQTGFTVTGALLARAVRLDGRRAPCRGYRHVRLAPRRLAGWRASAAR
jgi:hypothetical protein